MFVGPDIRGFKLVVFAPTRKQALEYVKSQWASHAHRALRCVGKGQPATPNGWCGAVVREEHANGGEDGS
jgi:hypothetical protein